MQQIAFSLGLDITVFSHQAQTLIRKNLVAKQASESDRRVYILKLTTEGKFVTTVINEQIHAYLDRIFAGMSESERDTVVRGLTTLNGAMEKFPICCE